MSDKKVGASWWREQLLGGRYRRPAMIGLGLLSGTSLLPGCWEPLPPRDPSEVTQSRDEIDLSMAALDLQRRQGWNVGRAGQPLALPGATALDAAGGVRWRSALDDLPIAFEPTQAQLLPYYVPTLFQSLLGPNADQLRAIMRPVRTHAMDVAYAKGQSILALFHEAGLPPDTAIVLDLPGPESVAAAAALGAHFDPVFTFANWPHPLGVVPSHETLGAALYYLPLFEDERATRPSPAPPVWVLDSRRLSEYTDEDGQFDNRYVAHVPNAEDLCRLGIKHVLYVVADESQQAELDDLNQPFVELARAGIDIKRVALTDFQQSDEEPPADEADASWPVSYVGGWFYYGGSWRHHRCFWRNYGWHQALHAFNAGAAGGHESSGHVSGGFQFVPSARQTRFSANFGRIAVRTSRTTSAITGVRPGNSGSFGRSGSLGRFHASGVSS